MRIISQDSRFDMPYELCAVYLNKEPMGETTIRCRWQADQKCSNVLAQYATEQNAKTAMEQLQVAFRRNLSYFRFPSNKELSLERGENHENQ